jgi:hypothetical protein
MVRSLTIPYYIGKNMISLGDLTKYDIAGAILWARLEIEEGI